MNGRIWKATLLVAMSVTLAAAGLGSARAPVDDVVMPATVADAERVALDAEIEALFAELGGGSNPESTPCCSANCILSDCTVCCSPGDLPTCACRLGEAECQCIKGGEAVQQIIDALTGGGSG